MNLTDLRKNPVYATANLVTNTLVVGVIPILLLSFLHWQIIRAMRRNTTFRSKVQLNSLHQSYSSHRDQTMAALLSGVILVLIVCHSPKAIINTYESYQVRNN